MSLAGLVSMIPDWLAVTASREVSIGLSREEALHRAAVLRRLLRDGKVKPEDVILDEDLKAVFHALVALVTEIEPRAGEALAQEANAVYQFLARVDWPDDDFGERKDLLTRCAEAGWRAMGTSLAEVEKRRIETQKSPGGVAHHFSTDPISTLTPSPRTRHCRSRTFSWPFVLP
jgi:hypothetical protein